MENELELKWRRIQQAMRQEEADGCLLTMNMNLYYVSGQVFNGYFYLPAEGRPYWFVKRLTIPETIRYMLSGNRNKYRTFFGT